MTIKIGDKTLAISRGNDLETKLIATTGFNIAEHAAVLAGPTTAFHMARVLHPMLSEPIAVSELSAAIDAAGTDGLRGEVLALLTTAPAAEATGKGAKADGGA